MMYPDFKELYGCGHLSTQINQIYMHIESLEL